MHTSRFHRVLRPMEIGLLHLARIPEAEVAQPASQVEVAAPLLQQGFTTDDSWNRCFSTFSLAV